MLNAPVTALVSDIIAPLHFANDPMQQARSDHFVLQVPRFGGAFL
jgi:hypothetical protein